MRLASILIFVTFCALANCATTIFNEYWDLDRINAYMHTLQENHPGFVSVQEMGITHENRTLFGVRIVNEQMLEQRNYSMPIIMITAGASARDWISVMAAMNVSMCSSQMSSLIEKLLN
jgi:hypothetical protein